MEVIVNQENHQFAESCSLEQMLTILNAPTRGIAVAVNKTIVPKAGWSGHNLKHGDQVILIKATQGG